MTWGYETNIRGPQGEKGDKGDPGYVGSDGPPNVLTIGTVTTVPPPNGVATATITGTSPAQVLNLGIPAGNTGAQGIQGIQGNTGAAGPPNVLVAGTTTTGAPGSAASITITGTSPSQTLNMTIPRGDVGAQGPQGATGPAGTTDWNALTNKPATFPPSTHTHPQSEITNLVSDLAAKAPLASPVFTGNPTAPTPTAGDNDTSVATTAFVATALSSTAITNIVRTVIQSSGTYTKPAGLKFLEVILVGGGGGSGGANPTAATTVAAGGGGGGAGTVQYLYKAADLPASVAYSVGAGGGASATGGNTVFNNLTAGGGSGGTGGSAQASYTGTQAGAGGGGSSTEPGTALVINGGTGEWGLTHFPITNWCRRATGGPSQYSPISFSLTPAVSTAGSNVGRQWGGGAMAATNGVSQGSLNPGAVGGAGVIVITEYL